MKSKGIEIVTYPDGRVDAANAALYLGLAEKTLAIWRSNGKGPRYIKQGRIFYRLTDLDEFLKRGTRETAGSR